MKKLHLICNAHIDPVWQWTWDEGISSAIATFKSAADIAEEFDYIFCHGESLLYEAIEKNAPSLFNRIKGLIKQGKWRISSGWYMQPDCNMPSGESIIRQIKEGQRYFKEKLGVSNFKVATSYDAFGHNIGLVQILKKCGYDGYLMTRPNRFQFKYPGKFFRWIGKDGSSVIVSNSDSYNSRLGESKGKIEYEAGNAEDVDYVLWGVGNHGGGPSRKDLQDIKQLDIDGVKVFHSTPEDLFMDNVKISGEVTRSLTPANPGCYSSMARVKMSHRETENLYYATEKMISQAILNGYVFDDKMFREAEKKFLLSEFHDILPGSAIYSGEKEGLELLNFAKKVFSDYRTEAFLYFVMNEKKAGEGEYPIFAYNYLPYEVETLLSAEFSLADQNWSNEFTFEPIVYDENNKELNSQCIKEESTINLDWRKKIVFKAKLKPFAINRFIVRTKKIQKVDRCYYAKYDVEEFLRDNKSILTSPVELITYDDSADPWAMSSKELHCIGENPCPFSRMSVKKAQDFFASRIENAVHIIEDGSVQTSIEDCVSNGTSNAVIEYTTYKNLPYTDIKVTVEFNDKNKVVKLKIPTPQGTTIGDGMYSIEEKVDGEICFQKWVGKQDKNGEIFAVINNGIYAGSFDDDNLYLTLLRGAGYCFHPIDNRDLYPQDRYLPRIDCGRYVFNIRLFSGNTYAVCKEAEIFNQQPYTQNAFPTGEQNSLFHTVSVSDNLLMTVCKKIEKDKMLIRLFNPTNEKVVSELSIGDKTEKIEVLPYAVVSVIFSNGIFDIHNNDLPL